MMNKHDYRQAMNSIKISDSFKSRTAQLMREERKKITSADTENFTASYAAAEKKRFIPFLRYGGVILTAAAVIAAVGTYAGSRSADIYDTTSADLSQAAEGAQPPSMAAPSSDNNTEYDSADADNAYPDFYSAGVGAGDPIIEEAIVEGTSPVIAEAKVSTALSDHLKSHPDAKFKGDAEISKYYLADSGEKHPDDMPSEFAQLDEMPDDVVNAAADAESNGEPTHYADPSEYAASKELYTQIGWNGYALTINIYDEESYYSYTILGNTITNNLLRQTYKLTPELSDIFEAFAKEQLGVQLYE